MTLIDGKAISEQVKQEIAAEVAEIVARGGKRPHLAAILVGHDGGSETYVAAKVKACEVCGFNQFHPSRMADRILGMGDIVSLVERAQEQYDEEEAKRLQKKIAKNQFDFNDFLSQIAQIKKMGNLKELASMIPGVGKAIKDIDIDDNAFKSIEAIIYSMTPEERSNPAILNGSRRQRIAKGSGTNIQEVNRLLKQFDQTRKMMKMVTGSKMGKMMPKLKR